MVEFDDPATMSDDELRGALMATDGERGDPIVDALLAEIERRHLDL